MIELKTADEFHWQFHGINEESALLVARLAHAMQLNRKPAAVVTARKTRRIKKIALTVLKKEIRWPDLPHQTANKIECLLGSVSTSEKMTLQLQRVSQIIANSSEVNGGFLVHGALTKWNNTGVILAGPGGVGKTTACERLPRSWSYPSDDSALIVKSTEGTYWAHPWPTWSRYMRGDMTGSWDVQAAVKLELICMLSQNKKDRVFQLPVRQAISELVDVSGQTFTILANGMGKGAIRRLNLMRFHNAVTINKKVPVCRLEIRRDGKFWDENERFLGAPAKIRKAKK